MGYQKDEWLIRPFLFQGLPQLESARLRIIGYRMFLIESRDLLMNDFLYEKVSKRVERRLSKSPRLAIINAFLFTLFTAPVGLWSKFTHASGTIDGVVYWVIVLWSIGLFAHIASLYIRSGARRNPREKIIQEEVLDAGESYQLEPDEMIDLHLRLSTDIEIQSKSIKQLMTIGISNLLLWPGTLILATLLYNVAQIITEDRFGGFFNALLILSLIGSFVLGLMLPLRELRGKQSDHTHDLYAIYGYKRKRSSAIETQDVETELEDDLPMQTESLASARKR